jgi:hypothetical protein
MKGRIHSTEPLPINDRRDKHTDTQIDGWQGFMKYAAEMGSGAMIYMPSFRRDWFRHLNVIGGGFIDRQHGDCTSLVSFFQNYKNRLKWAGYGRDKERMLLAKTSLGEEQRERKTVEMGGWYYCGSVGNN